MASIHRNRLSKFMNTRSGKLTKIKRRAKNTYLSTPKKSTKRTRKTAQSKSKSKSKVRRRHSKNTHTQISTINTINTPKNKYSLRKMISKLFK